MSTPVVHLTPTEQWAICDGDRVALVVHMRPVDPYAQTDLWAMALDMLPKEPDDQS